MPSHRHRRKNLIWITFASPSCKKLHAKVSPGFMACASSLHILALRPSQACQVAQQWLALKLTIASPPPQACAEFYLRIAPATCAFTLRLSRTYPHAAPSTSTLLASWHLRTASVISTFTLRLAATNSRAFTIHINALARCHNHKHHHTPPHYYIPSR